LFALPILWIVDHGVVTDAGQVNPGGARQTVAGDPSEWPCRDKLVNPAQARVMGHGRGSIRSMESRHATMSSTIVQAKASAKYKSNARSALNRSPWQMKLRKMSRRVAVRREHDGREAPERV
jgi:hypothetical protein